MSFAEPVSAAVAVLGGDADRVKIEHQVRRYRAADAAGELGGDQRRGGPRSEAAKGGLDEADDRVERGRDRLQREDERDKRGAGDQAVLQQLQPDVVW